MEPPLSDSEFKVAESRYHITFPEDLRAFYKTAMPSGPYFPNWRSGHPRGTKEIQKMLDWPLEGMLFDVKENDFWLPVWGERPTSIKEAEQICQDAYMQAPRLIPLYGHRYIPAELASGSPILSVYQTDIIYYGANLKEYFEVEFGRKSYENIQWDNITPPRFWGDIIDD